MEYNNAIMKFKEQNKEDNSTDSSNKVSDYLSKLNTKWSERPAPYKASTWENVGVAATPMLLGLLMGDVGTGAEHAAKGLQAQQKSEMDVAKKLYDHQIKLDEANKKSESSVNDSKNWSIENRVDPVTNKTMLSSVNKITGEVKPINAERGYAPKVGKTAEGETGIIAGDKFTKLANMGLRPEKGYIPTPKESAEVSSLAAKFLPEKRNYEKQEVMLETARKTIRSARAGQLGSKIGAMSLVKTVETKMSDEDRKFYNKNLGLLQSIIETFDSKKKGTFPERLRREAIATIKIMDGIVKKYKYNSAKEIASQTRGDKGYALSKVFPRYKKYAKYSVDKKSKGPVTYIDSVGNVKTAPAEYRDEIESRGYKIYEK